MEANGVTRYGLSHSAIKNAVVPLPPHEEQNALVEWVRRATRDLSSGISAAAREIDLIREYHARLIADSVTGKLDVREAAASLPDEAVEQEIVEVRDAMEEIGEAADGADVEAAAGDAVDD